MIDPALMAGKAFPVRIIVRSFKVLWISNSSMTIAIGIIIAVAAVLLILKIQN